MANADFLLREIERRGFERLDYIKLQPQVILDVGCGQGRGTVAFAQRFNQAQVIGLDQSPAMIAMCERLHSTNRRGDNGFAATGLAATGLGAKGLTAKGLTAKGLAPLANTLKRWLPKAKPAGEPKQSSQPIRWVCADTHQIPLSDQSVDLIWSNCAMHWFVDPREVIKEWRRILRPNGLLMFTCFGVQTLEQLAALGVLLPTFQDMHDIGDQMQNQKFAEPVMDMETLHLTYKQGADVLRDVRALGGNALDQRRLGLRGRGFKQQVLDRLHEVDRLTFEIVYGHAWAPAHRLLPDGYSPIEFRPRGP